MKIEVELPEYNPSVGFEFIWDDDYEIGVDLGHDGAIIKCNKAGLVSLAIQLLTLAQDEFKNGYDLHYSEGSPLSKGSIDLVIVKLDS